MRHVLLSLFLFVSLSAAAQCSKDTECKGNRICDKGVCTAPSPNQPQSVNASTVAVKDNAWSDEVANVVASALQDQLTCASRPEPGKALRALRTREAIGPKPIVSVDGMNIFAVTKPISVFGFKALQVTGWEESNDKSLFWRGPGTAPPLNFQVVVAGELAIVKGKVEKMVDKRASFAKASYSKYAGPATEITCYGN